VVSELCTAQFANSLAGLAERAHGLRTVDLMYEPEWRTQAARASCAIARAGGVLLLWRSISIAQKASCTVCEPHRRAPVASLNMDRYMVGWVSFPVNCGAENDASGNVEDRFLNARKDAITKIRRRRPILRRICARNDLVVRIE
jgi:hypothetical protein